MTDAPPPSTQLPPTWPRTAVLVSLGALAVVLAVQMLVQPEWNARSAPAGLSAATFVVCALVLRYGRRLEALATTTWRAFGAIAGLLALGHLVRAVTEVGVNPVACGAVGRPPRGDRADRRLPLRPPRPFHRRTHPRPGRAGRGGRAGRARRPDATAGPDGGRTGPERDRSAADRGLSGGQFPPRGGRTGHLRRGLAAAAAGGRLDAAVLRVPRGDHDQRHLRRRPSLGRARRPHDDRLPRHAGHGHARAGRRPRSAGPGPGAGRRGAAHGRACQLLHGLRCAPPAARGAGRGPADRSGRGGHGGRADGPHAGPHAGLGGRRGPAHPSGAADRGLLPHPRAPGGRPDGRPGRPRAGHLGGRGGRHHVLVVGARPRGAGTPRPRPRGRPLRAAPGAGPDVRRRRRAGAGVPAARARQHLACLRDGPDRVLGGPDRGGGGRRRGRRTGAPRPAATAWSSTCATSPGGGPRNSSSSGWPTPTT